jgi:hypothetical protein
MIEVQVVPPVYKPAVVPMHPVKSSSVTSIGFNFDTMQVQYTSGAVVQYPAFPPEQFNQIVQAESVGSEVSRLTKGTQFHTIK